MVSMILTELRIKLDNPEKPIDIGGDFTIEFWMKAVADSNNGIVYEQANGDGWITEKIILDRDVFGAGDFGDFGVSIGTFDGGGSNERTVCFGIDRLGTRRSIITSSNVADNSWKHIAITRVASSGTIKIFVNGILESTGSGPTGGVRYRNNRARKQIAEYIEFYNTKRLHSSLYYLTPNDYLEGTIKEKLEVRENKLQQARKTELKSEMQYEYLSKSTFENSIFRRTNTNKF